MSRLSAFAFLLVAGCVHNAPPPPAPAPPVVPPSPPPTAAVPASAEPPVAAPALPAMPRVEGPLSVHVVYPQENAPMASRDSNYMLGSVGNGHATLTINGHPATVYPNGAFMAFVPNPPATAPRFDLVAALGADTLPVPPTLRLPTEKLALPL